MKHRYTPAYTAEGALIYVPEVGMEYLPKGCQKIPLRGHKYTVAIESPEGNIIGWTNADSEEKPS
jgi:hypothetical protein